MLTLQCPHCAASYELAADSIGPEGRKVRCSACQTRWMAYPPDAVLEEGQEPSSEACDVAEPEPAEAAPAPVPEPSTPPARLPWHQRMRAPEGSARSRRPLMAAAAVAACLVAAVGLRKSIVSAVPETGRVFAAFGLPVNLSGLDLREIKGGLFNEGGTELLVVQGEIVNVTGATRAVPRLKFSVLDARGQEVYSWTAQADARELKPGEAQVFRRRLASPPPEGREVLVRFAGKNDLLALAK